MRPRIAGFIGMTTQAVAYKYPYTLALDFVLPVDLTAWNALRVSAEGGPA
ncbi:MAG: hypothetical protein R2748_34360 [Bryobacterales bacterium]